MRNLFRIFVFCSSAFVLLQPCITLGEMGYEGPGVELIGSGACVFLQEGSDGSYEQIRVPARSISQRHPGVKLSEVVFGSCTTRRRAVNAGTFVPSSQSDLPFRIDCLNISARSECLGDWSQVVLRNRAVKVDCICSEDPE